MNRLAPADIAAVPAPQAANLSLLLSQTAALFPDRPGLIQGDRRWTWAQIDARVNALVQGLRALGMQAGDRLLVQSRNGIALFESCWAAFRLGAVWVPVNFRLTPSEVAWLGHASGATAMLAEEGFAGHVDAVRAASPRLRHVITIGRPRESQGEQDYEQLLHDNAGAPASTAHVHADTPLWFFYTSGTTGHPKGALHAHRVLLGHLPGVCSSHDDFPQPGDRMWTPADWAWIGGLLDVLLPAWYHGVPVVAYRADKFVAEDVFELIADLQIKNVFFPPTALKLLRSVENPRQRWPLALRSVASGGESLGDELLAWGDHALGVRINEFYGQTECNLVVSSCASQGIYRAHAIGRAVEGFNVAIVDDYGVVVPAGGSGHIAVATPNGSQMLRYWENSQATEDKYLNGWLVTGDKGSMDDDGYIYFLGRNDDVITSAGYRIGPTPIEDCLIKHPAVKLAAAIGKKDPIRTEVVKAFVVLNHGYAASDDTVRQLQAHVRAQLAAHEYPREIEFLDELPMTTTGKIIRKALRELEEQRTAMELDT